MYLLMPGSFTVFVCTDSLVAAFLLGVLPVSVLTVGPLFGIGGSRYVPGSAGSGPDLGMGAPGLSGARGADPFTGRAVCVWTSLYSGKATNDICFNAHNALDWFLVTETKNWNRKWAIRGHPSHCDFKRHCPMPCYLFLSCRWIGLQT